MLSARAKGWKWYDWLILFVIVIFICAAIIWVAPASGLAHGINIFLHSIAAVLQLFAEILSAIASALNRI